MKVSPGVLFICNLSHSVICSIFCYMMGWTGSFQSYVLIPTIFATTNVLILIALCVGKEEI